MIRISKVTRYTIPIEGSVESLNWDGGTTAHDLFCAIGKIPNGAKISTDFGRIFATYVHDDIEVDTPERG